MLQLMLLAVACQSTAIPIHHLELFGRNTTHLPGLFGRNHTHLLGLLGQKLTDQLHLLGHELRIHQGPHDEYHPGWLPNILNPLVRAAFPKANAYFLAYYTSNVTFDGPGRNRSHPMDPSYEIPTIKPPAKRRVPELNPPHNATLDEPEQSPGLVATPQNTSANASEPIPTNLQSRPALPELVLQAAPQSSLTSGQQLQQVPTSHHCLSWL